MSYCGGTGSDTSVAIATDNSGNVFIGGQTNSLDLPLQSPAQSSYGGGSQDGWVAKFDPAGNLVFATYLGGNDGSGEGVRTLATDADGNILVGGFTSAPDFPLAAATQPSYGGGTYDGFLVKLDATGGLVFATFLGGSGNDDIHAVTTDPVGNVWATGETNSSSDFPLRNPFQPVHTGPALIADAFLSGFTSGGALNMSSYLGGSGFDIGEGVVVEPDGTVSVIGRTASADFPTRNPIQNALASPGITDAFVTSVDPVASSIRFSSYIGGAGTDIGYVIAPVPGGGLVLSGSTSSTDFPTHAPLQAGLGGADDVFVARLDPSRTRYLFSTYLGGSATDGPGGIAIDGEGTIHLAGRTASADWPLAPPIQPPFSGPLDGFYAALNGDGSELYRSTYVGGSGIDAAYIALSGCETVYLGGRTSSPDLPATPGAFQSAYAGGGSDAFLLRAEAAVAPPAIGNTLLVVHDPAWITLSFFWTGVPIATGYSLLGALTKGIGFPLRVGITPQAPTTLSITAPPDPVILFNVVGSYCGRDGPL